MSSKKLSDTLMVILLICASMNLFAKFYYFIFAIFFLVCLSRHAISVNRSCILYLCLSILFGLYNVSDGMLAVLRCFTYVMIYIAIFTEIIAEPYCLAEEGGRFQGSEHKSLIYLLAISGGSFVHFALNFFTNFGSDIGRNTNDIWTGDVMSATIQAGLACIMVGYSIAMILVAKTKKERIFGVVISVVILAYNLMLAGRTLLFIYLITFICGLLFFMGTDENRTDKTRLFGFICFVILLVVIVYALNVGGIQEYIQESNLYQRFFESTDIDFTDTERNGNKLAYIKNGYKYLFGGLNLRKEYGYAHDLLLDGYDEYGILGFILLVSILVSSIRQLYYFLRFTPFSNKCKISFLCTYIAIFLEFTVEPILSGMMWLFVCFCLMNGCIAAMNEQYFDEPIRERIT